MQETKLEKWCKIEKRNSTSKSMTLYWVKQSNQYNHKDSLMQKRRNSIANALELQLFCINSSPLSAAYMRQWIRSALVKIVACRLFGAKPLSKPMLGYGQLDPLEQTSVTF